MQRDILKENIEFVVKLGYSVRLAWTAIQRLGSNPSLNELLKELIKMAEKQPPWALSPAPPAEPKPDHDRAPLRPILIDGRNVAMSHGNEVFSCRGIEICVEWFRARGHREITAFVPKWRKEASRPSSPLSERGALDRLDREGVLVASRRHFGGKRRYILDFAARIGGIVVSNDKFCDLAAENPDFRKVVEEQLLMYSFVNDRFMPSDDPLGRSGRTLDAFLQAPESRAADPPPSCPYGRKCTYGYKCKFQHLKRAGWPSHSDWCSRSQPQARVQSAAPRLANSAMYFDTEQLTLNSTCEPRLQRHALASRVASAPDAGAAGLRAPLLSPCASVGARPFTRSGWWNISSTGQQSEQQARVQFDAPRLANSAMHFDFDQLTLNPACEPGLQRYSLASRVASAPDAGAAGRRAPDVGAAGLLLPCASVGARPDVRSAWWSINCPQARVQSAAPRLANSAMHFEFDQLTLNPAACEPRLQHHVLASRVASAPDAGVVGLRATDAGTAGLRAPDAGAAGLRTPLLLPCTSVDARPDAHSGWRSISCPQARVQSATPRLANSAMHFDFDQLTLNPACEPRLQSHALASRVASAPDARAVGLRAPDAYEAGLRAPDVEAAGLRAPLLSPCASVNALQHWSARHRMHYDLASIFPEAQVVEAMAAHSDETDAQTMCAIILERYGPPAQRNARAAQSVDHSSPTITADFW